MNVVEKAEKALEHIKNIDGSAKSHELQAAAGTLGRCLGVLGSRQNYARHYANLLHCAIPTLLSLASNDSAEIRLLGDEALNRAVVGGFAFHSYKTNIILQNQIDNTRNARWIRAALSRICLGDCWLRPGVGKIRAQAQTLFPKLSQIVRQTSEIQLIVDALESNLPRILNALGEYTTDEELSELSSAVLRHVPGGDAAVRRAAAACAAQLAARRRRLLAGLLARALDNLWPSESDSNALLGWFGVVKAIFQTNDPQQLADSEVLTVQDYLELYEVCVHHLERSPEHNVQNAVMECLAALLARAPPARRRALLERRPPGARRPRRPERPERAEPGRDGSPVAGARAPPPLPLEAREPPGLALSGALQLGGLSPLPTPSRSLEDLTIQTLESPASDSEVQMPAPEQLTRDLSERLHELEDAEAKECDHVDQPIRDTGFKINIGASSDDDIPLKYCARLLASKFLLTGNKGEIISDRSVRVSVKASALNCLSEILRLYPQAMTMYLDKDAEAKSQNVSGSSDATESTQEQTDDFVLERNVCYQDSMTDSLSRELLDRSTNSQQATLDRMITGRDQSRSTEKSVESVEQKSSLKDVPSNMLDSRVYAKSDLVASGVSADSTQNMTASNFTTNSNTTGSNDPLSTGYPMTSSGDPLSSSLDLDMKLDHFGESPNLDNLDALREFERRDAKRPLKRTDEVCSRDAPDLPAGADAPDEPAAEGRDAPDEPDEPDEPDPERRFAFQHMSDVFALLAGHGDPHIRGLVRACAGGCLAAALDLAHAHAHADCAGGQEFSLLPREGGAGGGPGADDLVEIVLKGLSDDIHSAVNHSLAALTHMAASLSDSAHWALLVDALNCLVRVETNAYWLCRVNLCRFYEKLPYKRLFMLYPEYHTRNKLIMDTLFRLLADQDQKVRNASAQAIATITPQIYLSKRLTPTSMVAEIAMEQTRHLTFDSSKSSLEPVRDMYFCGDLPAQLRGRAGRSPDGLGIVVSQLFSQLMSSSCKYYSQGLLEALHAVSKKWTPWKYKEAYSEQGILSYCLDSLDLCNGTVVARTIMMDLCTSIYPVEIHNIMHNKPTKTEIFERDYLPVKDKWQHLDNANMAALSEKFLQITLKMLNVLAHLIEEVNPNVHMNKSGIALPGSPVRRKTQEPSARRASNASDAAAEERAPPRRRPAAPPAASLRANFAGHFYNEPFYMRLYENLRAMYSNHKINLDPTSSIFYEFLTSVLNSLAIQLEMATERELGSVTEEILYYLKIIMPLRPDLTVYCITQLLKCLFGTNMINQYQDFMTISDPIKIEEKTCFYRDVMMVNALDAVEEDSMDGVESTSSQKLSTDSKNTRMTAERQLLMAMENFTKNKTDRKWSTNKKELERYIRLFEPVVIQALKSYTMQNDVPLQCRVLGLLNQLLTLRVNYCMLDSDQVFIGFLMKQLDLVEQHEIPNCCELVNSILMFLVHLSSSKHHTKQIIEIPKLIQLCDGLMASGAQAECIAGLEPVAVRVFSNMGGVNVLGRAQQQEAQATREVLFYMLQKTMHQHKVLDIVSCVLALSRDQPESYYRWSELAADTLLNLLAQRSVEVDSAEAVASLERLLEAVYRDVLLEQSRVELLLKILFKAPPDQATTSHKLKLRYLSIIMVLIRKVFVLVPESEILLSINYLKSTFVSPQSIFFNVKTDIDPLNVQNVNENCANLSPDVILVRFLFKTLTYAIVEVDSCHACLDFNADGDTDQNGLLVSVCVNIIVQVKHMLHLTTGCRFPLCAKTARALLHSERSGLNTGLYSPDENIPLERLNVVCLSGARRVPLLTAHWSHLLIRLNFLSHQYWQRLVGFARRRPLGARARRGDARLLCASGLQVACVLAYCEYFLDNGLSEAVHLSWLLASRVHVLGGWGAAGGCGAVRALLRRVHAAAGASGLLLQAFAARCQPCLKDEFALNAYKILSLCHESQSGALVFLICRIIGKLEPAVAVRFANLAIERCKMLKEMPIDQIHAQLSKEDVQVALELLQRDKVHIRHPPLALALGALAAGAFDLSPLDLSPRRAVSARYVVTARADGAWLLNQIKSRCCKTDCTMPKVSKYNELALILLKLPNDDLSTVMTCPEFDRRLLSACFRVACDDYTREFLNVVSVYETKEMERERLKEQIEASKREQTLSPVDSNKLNVVNTLHVFKKSDRVDSKSQFFIPVTDNSLKEFGNLQIADDEAEIVPPEFSDLYRNSIEVLDKSLGDIIRLFPKQNRPLSQSENFNLNVEQTIDRYTRRCHQVFQDKLFHDEFVTIHTILTGFLDSLGRIIRLIDGTDCDLLDKCIETIIPGALAKNIAIFSVISLQYLSFIIKNKELVESPARADVSFRATASVTDDVVVDHVVAATLRNVADALRCDVWAELNGDPNANRPQSAIGCLYAVVKYLVKDTKPLILKKYMQTDEPDPKQDIIIVGNKLVTLIEYWETNFYANGRSDFLGKRYRKPIERLIVSLSRLELMSNTALVPPLAWVAAGAGVGPPRVELPLQALQDMDVLESFLFRVNLIGWSSKKQFEEIWVALLGALQGNGTHWAVRGIAQLLGSTAPRVRAGGAVHVPRTAHHLTDGMQRLRSILVGTSSYKLLEDVNLERIPLMNDDFDGYHYAQFDTEYLKLASDIIDDATYKVRREVKRMRRNKEIDVNSCLQLLMDVTSQMLEPKAPTGVAARVALLAGVTRASDVFTETGQWCWAAHTLVGAAGAPLAHYSAAARALLAALATCLAVLHGFEGLHELSSVQQRLLKSLSSSHAPLRQAALHGCLLQLAGRSGRPRAAPCRELVAQLALAVRTYLAPGSGSRISPYEQSLYWTVLFALVELGHPELMTIAVDFLLAHPAHYCTDLVVKGITSMIRQQVLPKDLKNNIIEKLLDKAQSYSERHAVEILMVHLFSVDSKLLRPRPATDASGMDPDVLMSAMERVTLLYKAHRRAGLEESRRLATGALKRLLRETLPPAASLSRAVIEFIEWCAEAERRAAGPLGGRAAWAARAVAGAVVVFEVFETAVSQDQLPVLSGWIFEALCHLLSGKVSTDLLPHCLLLLLVSASSNPHIRALHPLCCHILRSGLRQGGAPDDHWGIFKDYVSANKSTMSFTDRRLLCIVAYHSNFTPSQLDRLRELCEGNECLNDLLQCLDA